MAVNQKAVKVLNKILEAGFTDEKAIAAMTMDDILSMQGITVADISLINDLQKSIKANKVISFLAAMRRSATLLSISGTDMRRKDGNGFSRQRNYSAASLPRILWRALRSGIPNIAGNFPHQSSRQTMIDNEIPYGHTIMPIKWAGTKKGAINEKI